MPDTSDDAGTGSISLRRRLRHLLDRIKYWRRQFRRGLHSPATAALYHRHRAAVERADWQAVLATLPDLARRAEALGEIQLVEQLARAADRLNAYELGSHLECTAARLRGNEPAHAWRGEPLAGARLVVDFMETEKQGAATGLRHTGYVADAATEAGNVVLVTEPRLVPLYARTFPAFDVRPGPQRIEAESGRADYFANMRILRSVIGSSAEGIRSRFLPLKADAEKAALLRRRYGHGKRLLVGLSWWSSHHGKDLPPLDRWAALMRETDADFISLQYGDRQDDIAYLEQASGRRLVIDPDIDQLRDMDGFAAQLAALDAVVSISGTGAHLACALGIPTVLLRDDWFRRDWPVLSSTTPWCPSAVVVGRNGRSWAAVFAEIQNELGGILAEGGNRT